MKFSAGKVMPFLSLAFAILCSLESFGQKKVIANPYLTLKYDSVVLYDFECRTKTASFIPIVDDQGKLAPTVKKRAKLHPKLAAELSQKIGEKAAYGQGTSMCFVPHLGIVYYRSGKPVSDINVCFECNKLQSNLRIPAQEQGIQRNGNDVYYIQDGMSLSFRKYLNSLIQPHKFSHQIKNLEAIN